MTLLLRPAELADIGAIVELGSDPAFEAGGGMPFYYRPEVLAEWIEHPAESFLWVAEEGGETIGFLFCKMMHSRWAMLDTFYLAPACRGRGWGRALLEMFLDRLRERGVFYLSALVLEGRGGFEQIAAKLGLEPHGKYSWWGTLLRDFADED
jgi:ribosomal protein S18 acetylase RimI-like enzyme